MLTADHRPFILPSPVVNHDLVTGLASRRSVPPSTSLTGKEQEPTADYPQGTETILFVEDLESLRDVIADSLEQLGYNVLASSSGEDALSISNTYRGEIHLLLTDVIMPQMKGPELAKKLHIDRPRMKIIYVSGYSDGVLAPHGVLEPGTILLHKPFTIKILAAKLREVLDE